MDEEIRYTINTHEGGYNNVPGDAGGETKFGISKAQYPNIDIEHLTLDEAVKIYERDYWAPLLLDQITNVKVRWKIFDIAVNRGTVRAAMMVQGIVGVQQDGHFGPMTIAAINKMAPQDLVYKLSFAMIDHYVNRALKVPDQTKFLRGWVDRAMDFGDGLASL